MAMAAMAIAELTNGVGQLAALSWSAVTTLALRHGHHETCYGRSKMNRRRPEVVSADSAATRI
jgi:hypothetical protein